MTGSNNTIDAALPCILIMQKVPHYLTTYIIVIEYVYDYVVTDYALQTLRRRMKKKRKKINAINIYFKCNQMF